MANKITNLRNWINGQTFNARDYIYERNLIVALVNNHEDRVTTLEINNTTNTANIVANTANIAANTANIATNTNKISNLETFTDNLQTTFLDKITTTPQTVEGQVTFNSEVILNGINLDSELESLDGRITSIQEIVDNRIGSKLYTDLDEPTDQLTGDIWFDSGG
jgi:galactose-1-phosphate uridylyltransferase